MIRTNRSAWRLGRRTALVVVTVVCFLSLHGAVQRSTASSMPLHYSSLTVFGDSTADAGNLFNFTNIPSSPPYNQKFSNGSVWVELLADKLEISTSLFSEIVLGASLDEGINFAFADSFSLDRKQISSESPSLLQQVKIFTAGSPGLDTIPEDLFAISTGGNEYNAAIANPDLLFVPPSALPSLVTDSIVQAASDLIDIGAEHLFVTNLPDLGHQPFARQLSESYAESESVLSSLSSTHNTLLKQKLTALSKSSGVDIMLIDIDELLDEILTEPSRFGFTNTQDACLVGSEFESNIRDVCDRPEEFVFWDSTHLTDAVQQLIAKRAIAMLRLQEK